jgi:hypothetical protein
VGASAFLPFDSPTKCARGVGVYRLHSLLWNNILTFVGGAFFVCDRSFSGRWQREYVPNSNCSAGDTTKHWEAAPRKRKRSSSDSNAQTLKTVETTLAALFHGKERKQKARAAATKTANDAAKIVRHNIINHGHIEMWQAMSVVRECLHLKGQAVRLAPPGVASPTRISALSADIGQYLIKRGLARSTRAVAVHAAAIVAMLCHGYAHHGVQLVPKLDWVRQAAPGDNQYSTAPHVVSRAMSIATRALKASMVSPTDHPVIANRLVLSSGSL